MKKPFREHHLILLLEEYEAKRFPLDLLVNNYFRAHKALGSKDRGYIADTVFAMMRWRGLLDQLSDKSWEGRFEAFKTLDPKEYIAKEEIPLHVRVSFPKLLFDFLVESHGVEKATALCLASNQPAPTMIRVNTLKTTREELLKVFEGVSPGLHSPYAIQFEKKTNFFSLPEFKQGFFEVQDEASQLVALLVKAKPGQHVLDYCSGSGGKTLAFAPQMQGSGQIYLHDVRPSILQECRKRLCRAGVQNSQIMPENDPRLPTLKGRMDWVLVDAPCSGTGTIRRNPDMKWRFSKELLDRCIADQRAIFAKAVDFLQPKGRIVYATCSMLRAENQDQLAYFVETHGLVVEEIFQTFPEDGGMDGFFAAVLKKSNSL